MNDAVNDRDRKGDISLWIQRFKEGDREAAAQLYTQHFEQLVRLAGKRLQDPASAEDAAQSAFASFFKAGKAGRFADLADRGGLWRLLCTMTVRKAIDRIRRNARAPGNIELLEQLASETPTPQWQALTEESCRRLLDLLDERQRQLALLKLEGQTNKEIGAALECSERTVERELQAIRVRWERELPP